MVLTQNKVSAEKHRNLDSREISFNDTILYALYNYYKWKAMYSTITLTFISIASRKVRSKYLGTSYTSMWLSIVSNGSTQNAH